MVKAGKVSAPEVQEATTAFKQAGSASTEVGKLATAGKDGAIRGNVSRDVMNTLGKSSDLPETYTTKTVFWDSVNNKQIHDDMDFLIPCEIVEQRIEKDGDMSSWTSLPANSPHSVTKGEWTRKNGVVDADNFIVGGLWGDGAV